MLTLEALAARFRGPAKHDPKGLTVFCPVHPDGQTNNRPSLRLTKTPRTGGLHVFCWAGCDEAAILAAAHLTLADLAPERPRNGHGPRLQTPRLVAAYPYTDADGTLLYEVCRFEPKDFRQRRSDGAGGWLWNMSGVRRVPYRLPELAGAACVFIPEGEKDCDALRAIGLVATCNVGGAGKWTATETAALVTAGVGAVVILPDHDAPGVAHAAKVAASCHGAGLSVRVLELPELPDKGDVSDWLAMGHGVAELLGLRDAASGWTPDQPAAAGAGRPDVRETVDAIPPDRFTDMVNAHRFVEEHAGAVHYCWPLKVWFCWDGTRWVRDAGALVLEHAKATARGWWRVVEALPTGGAERKRALRHAEYSESARGLRATLELAQSEPGIPIAAGAFDSDPLVLNTPSGTVDLRTGALRPWARADYCSQMTTAPYEPSATDPVVTRFLETTFPDSAERAYVQTVLGYSATGSTAEEQAYAMLGPTAAGKTTLTEGAKVALGDYAMSADFETFRPRKHDAGPREDLVRLARARLVVVAETRAERLDAAVLKRMCGGDTAAGRQLYRGTEEYRPLGKVWMVGNVRPVVDSDDDAVFRRLREIPMPRSLAPEDRDPAVKATLTNPDTGGRALLTWIVAGAMRWHREGLHDSPAVRAASAAYRAAMDHGLGEFVADRVLVEPGAWVAREDVRDALTTWLQADGVTRVPDGRVIAAALRRVGAVDRKRNSRRGWEGVRLRTPADDPAPAVPAPRVVSAW